MVGGDGWMAGWMNKSLPPPARAGTAWRKSPGVKINASMSCNLELNLELQQRRTLLPTSGSKLYTLYI